MHAIPLTAGFGRRLIACLGWFLLSLSASQVWSETFRETSLTPPDSLTPIIMASPEVWPWGSFDAQGEPFGTLVQFADRLAAISNRPINNRLRPHRRAVKELATGGADFVTLFKSPEAEAAGIAVDTIMTVKILIVGRAGDDYPLTLAQLRGQSIGYIRGTYYGEAFADDEGVRKVPVGDLRQAVAMLRLGRIDALVASNYAFSHTLADMGLPSNAFRRDEVIADQKGILYMSRKARHPELLGSMKEALQQMHETGEMADIFRLPR